MSSQDFDDIINTLLSQIWSLKERDARYLCELYLRSACQKHLFAETRLKNLRSKIAYRKRRYTIVKHEGYVEARYPQNTLSIEMDFDHCILSLRSSLEHLAQLVNALIPLNLPPKGKTRESVNLKRVIDILHNTPSLRSIPSLDELSTNLRIETVSTRYNELHDLRIESFHIKSGRLPHMKHTTREHHLIDLKFLLPDGTATSLKTEEERDILNYCKSRVNDVQRTLNGSFHVLSKYMSYKLG